MALLETLQREYRISGPRDREILARRILNLGGTLVAETPYGSVVVDEHGARIYGAGVIGAAQLYAWAHRPGAVWPCSALADLDDIAVAFDARGDLVDISGDSEDLTADELNAWTSDVLRAAGVVDHPAIRGEEVTI